MKTATAIAAAATAVLAARLAGGQAPTTADIEPGQAPQTDRSTTSQAALVASSEPEHWRPLPALARPARSTFDSLGADVDAVARAWGDPAGGVYALLLTGRANVIARPRKRIAIATDVHDRLHDALEDRGASLDSWMTETEPRTVNTRAAIGQFGQRGELVMWSGYDAEDRLLAAVAICFRNDRVVERTERECKTWLESLRPTVTPVALDPDVELPDVAVPDVDAQGDAAPEVAP